jgi:START domain
MQSPNLLETSKMSMKSTVYISFFLMLVFNATAQYQPEPCSAWKKADERGNTKVYVRECDDSPIKEFKVNDRFTGDFDKLVKIMMAPHVIKLMSDRCVEARDLKKLSDNQVIQYYRFDMPMGVTDRDVISKLTVWQTPTALKTLSESVYQDELEPLKQGVIRLQSVRTSFYFEKQADGTIFMEYTGRTDPNGSIPAWLVNFLATREARKMVEKLKELVQN